MFYRSKLKITGTEQKKKGESLSVNLDKFSIAYLVIAEFSENYNLSQQVK